MTINSLSTNDDRRALHRPSPPPTRTRSAPDATIDTGQSDGETSPALRMVWGAAHTDGSGPLSLLPAPIGAATAGRACERSLPVGGTAKRIMDLAIAVAAGLLLLPAILFVAALMKVTTGGPVLFAHERVGLGGRRFRCFKFRTMTANADELLAALLAKDAAANREWNETRKLRHDPRITPLGRMLRKSSLDELPQIWNVITGDMSCVGPRPIVESEMPRYGSSLDDYLGCRPGLTGLWQVSGRSSVSYRRRVAMDRYYARRWSVGLDLAILLKTIPALVNTGDSC